METENDYLEAVNDMKKQYEEKERELKSEKERSYRIFPKGTHIPVWFNEAS